ncbi:MAG: hypothetical protein RL090_699, partial [Bacteroidota bacterium]
MNLCNILLQGPPASGGMGGQLIMILL